MIHVKSHSIVLYHQLQPVPHPHQFNPHGFCSGMACDVCQPFLCHTVQARDHVLRQLLRDIFADEPGIETGTSLKVINQPSEGNGQAQIIQNRGMKLMGEAANRRITTVSALVVTALVCALNATVLASLVGY